MKIYQLLPTLHYGDAIGRDALNLKHFFASQGFDSKIFSIDCDSELVMETEDYRLFNSFDSHDSVIIYHYALPSVLSDVFAMSKGKKILVYHNITPEEFLQGYPHLQRLAMIARNSLKSLKSVTDLGVADSEYNRQELESMGYKNTCVIPILLDFSRYETGCNPVISKMFLDDFTNILFVGRLTPNKCQHDLIRLYAYYKHFIHERSRLFLIGKWDGFENYYWQLRQLSKDLNVADTYILGRVTDEELVTFYTSADIFVSMSEHEGFCVPIIESFLFDVPVVAYDAAAVPYTLGNAGIRFRDKSAWIQLAELLHWVKNDLDLRAAVIERQRERLKAFSVATVKEQWLTLLGLS
ncbi:glycosyltransferase [bacterium]|nr:glycosyltransferase [candidate division CSSED10-310 bacterium]